MLTTYPFSDPIRILTAAGVIDLPLEDYLRHVVPAEMPASWPLEALKAQAVAARSYALHAVLHPRHREAPLCATQHCQVWNPSLRHPRSDQAVAETAGQVLLWEGEPLCAMYSAECGGHTDDGSLPYLRGVPCPSTGARRGHGLGLCQYGARALADQGLTHEAILLHYYALPQADAPSPEALRSAALALLGQTHHPALAEHAHAHHLGAPLASPAEVTIAGRPHLLQPFAAGIAYAPLPQGDPVQSLPW